MKKLAKFTLFYTIFALSLFARSGIGIELNLPRFLTINDLWQSFSGGVSYFSSEQNVEYAFPIYFVREHSSSGSARHKPNNNTLRIISVDFHYRKFLNGNLNGFYLDGFGRLSNISGKVPLDDKISETTMWKNDTLTRFGLGVGFGARRFFNFREHEFYYGFSIMVGRYFNKSSRDFSVSGMSLSSMDANSDFFIDGELFKIGYLF